MGQCTLYSSDTEYEPVRVGSCEHGNEHAVS
jgi:hypothetical protein